MYMYMYVQLYFEKVIVTQLVKNFPAFIETKDP
jgi:hypothetical protein